MCHIRPETIQFILIFGIGNAEMQTLMNIIFLCYGKENTDTLR